MKPPQIIWPAMAAAALIFAATGLSPFSFVLSHAQKPDAPPPSIDADLARLKPLLPDQSHAMVDVGYHFANAWFAGQARNWPLAKFYVDETGSHIAWAVRIIPVRKGPDKKEFPLQIYADALVKGPLAELKSTVEKQDGTGFEKAYTATLASCYACHVASDKPYLRLRIPDVPAAAIIQLSP